MGIVVRSAARISDGITAHRKGMPRRVVALIRAGGDVTRYCIGERSVPSALFASRICQSRTGASKWSFLLFLPFVTIEEKREGEPQIVSFISGVFPVSVVLVVSSLDFCL